MIGELVSGEMIRRELKYMAEAHGGSVERLAPNSSFGISIRDGSGGICLVALLDSDRKRLTDIAVPPSVVVRQEVYRELFEYVREKSLSIEGVEGKCAIVRDAAGDIHSVFDLPAELEMDCSFNFHGAYDIALPRILRSTADFIMIGARITSMCQMIEIGGDADFSECDFETFPDNSVFHRNLVVRSSTIRRLPREISVGRWLKMGDTGIDALPVSARIGTGIDAENSSLRIIPPGFTLTGDLLLSGTRVRRLSGVHVGGSVFVERVGGIEIGDDCLIAGNVYTDEAGLSVPSRISNRVFVRNPFGYERRGTAAKT